MFCIERPLQIQQPHTKTHPNNVTYPNHVCIISIHVLYRTTPTMLCYNSQVLVLCYPMNTTTPWIQWPGGPTNYDQSLCSEFTVCVLITVFFLVVVNTTCSCSLKVRITCIVFWGLIIIMRTSQLGICTCNNADMYTSFWASCKIKTVEREPLTVKCILGGSQFCQINIQFSVQGLRFGFCKKRETSCTSWLIMCL